jgi:hypothetical protein
MSERDISGQQVLSKIHGPKETTSRKRPKRDFISGRCFFRAVNFRQNFLARNASIAHLDTTSACQSVALSVAMAKTRHSGRMFGRKTAQKRSKHGSEDKNLLKQEIMSEIIYTPRLAQNALFFFCSSRRIHRRCQSVVLSVYMAQNHALRAHVWVKKTARKRANRDRIWIRTARPNFN